MLNDANDSKFVIKKWNAVYYFGFHVHTEVLKYNLCDCSGTYFLVTDDVTITAADEIQVPLKIVHHLLSVSQNLMEQQ